MATRKKTRPYQLYIPEALFRKGREKADINGIPIAPFLLMAYQNFVDRPIEESHKLLREFNEQKSAQATTPTVRKKVLVRPKVKYVTRRSK